ncbi:MAG: hypothetical protein WAV56_02900, partial [Microgenomates group bacterium]
MIPKDILLIIDECKKRLETESIDYNDEEVSNLVKTDLVKAKEIYEGFSDPKLMSLDTYTSHWIRESLNTYFIQKTIKKVSPESRDNLIKTIHGFLDIFPPRIQNDLRTEIFSEKSYEKKMEIWKEKNLSVSPIENKFKELITARNEKAKEKGYSSYISQSLNQYQIPESEFILFKENIDKVISFCNHNLPIITMPVGFYSEFG